MKSSDPERIRAFIAIEIPAAIQQKIIASCVPLYALPDRVTWVKPQNIHLSLRFLGEVSIEQLPKIKTTLSQATETCTAFPIAFTDIGVFPNIKRPRVIWWGLNDSTAQLSELKQELDSALRACGFAPERRAFKPHLTLGRIRKLKDSKRLVSMLHDLSLPKIAQLKVEQVHLMRSQLRPQGPIYTELYSAPLGGL